MNISSIQSKTFSYKINIQRLCCISHTILMLPLCCPIYFLLIRTSCNDKKKVMHQELHGFADLNRNNSMFLPHKLNQCILCDNFQLLASCTLFPTHTHFYLKMSLILSGRKHFPLEISG